MTPKAKNTGHVIEASVLREASEYGVSSVLVALSGGADSVAVAYALNRCGIKLKALHCNFHLRGEESDRDMEFVAKFCKENNIPLGIIEFNVEEYLKMNKGESTEMACRNLRFRWFEQQLQETAYDRIVTGHNADDNIETFFINLLRGTGTRGLKGMDADNGRIWRPLLSFHRKDILDYLSFNSLEYVVDSTNLKSDYRRNFLRNKVIPLLKEEWKGFNASLDTTIRNLNAENKIVERFIEDTLPAYPHPLSVDTIIKAPAPMLIIKRFIDPFGPFSTTASEILSAIKANKPHIRRWKLRNGVAFLRNGKLFVEMSHGESRS